MDERAAARLQELQEELSRAHQDLDAIHRTKLFRYSASLRRLYRRVRRPAPSRGHSPPVAEVVPVTEDHSYQAWMAAYDTLDGTARDVLERRCAQLEGRPLISVLLARHDTAGGPLRASIESVRHQLWADWELCIADDGSSDPTTEALLEEHAGGDPRIKVVRTAPDGDAASAWNAALSAATGEWVAMLAVGDELAPHALALVALEIGTRPDAAMLYSDEDRLDEGGRRHSPYFKPDFDPVLLLGQDYPCRLSVMRLDRVRAVGGFRPGLGASSDWDLVLRLCELAGPGAFGHIPHVLYHRGGNRGPAAGSALPGPSGSPGGQRAVAEHLRRGARAGEVSRLPSTEWNRVRWPVPEPPPLVSIVIPTRDGQYLDRCIDSIALLTTYPRYEIVVIDNGSRSPETLEYLRAHAAVVRTIRDERPFNFAALNNAAVAAASGELVCLLNDDTEVLHADWLEELVGQCTQPGVGAVGAKLYYPNGKVQHAGVLLGLGEHGVAGHPHRLEDRLSVGYFGRLCLAQTFSAVTGACLVVRRAVWDLAGGLDADHLPIAFNDIDFCLRIREAGWRVVWTPFAELIHHESLSRGSDFEGPRAEGFLEEVRYMKQRWGPLLLHDPAYNPNLTLTDSDFSLAWPPRVGLVAED